MVANMAELNDSGRGGLGGGGGASYNDSKQAWLLRLFLFHGGHGWRNYKDISP